MQKRCRHCDLELEASREGFAGPVVINYSISLVVTFGYILLAYRSGWFGETGITVSGAAVALTLIIGLYPVVKTYWLHWLYHTGFLGESKVNR